MIWIIKDKFSKLERMKLLRLQLHKSYRSLDFDQQKFPKLELIKNELDPICLVGLNGSGKSNLLELVADIFYKLETDLLDYKVAKSQKPYVPYSDNKRKKEIYFEIDYSINYLDEIFYVRITRTLQSKLPTMSLYTDDKFSELKIELGYNAESRIYLPKVVAYTSGLNDLLSMPFIELQDYYAREVTHQVKVMENLDASVSEPNLLLMDFDSNAAIIVSNYLLNDVDKLKIFDEFARIQSLNSFRIVIQLDKVHGNKEVLLPNNLKKIINDLKSCSTSCNHIISKKGDYYEMNFLLNDVTKKLFLDFFESPRKLFLALSNLNLLNALCVQPKYRTELRKKRKEGQLLRFPSVPAFDKIFRIEDIELVLSKPNVKTEYLKISDGEHQFMHIVGGMLLFDETDAEREVIYLLDEPDTHFNPQWRSEFFRELDKVLVNKNHEIMLTTHSPFIIGDCHGYNVFIFERNLEDHSLNFSRSEYETFGTNFSFLLQKIFKFSHQMSDKSREHLENIEKKIKDAEGKLHGLSEVELTKLDKELKLYGESIEKLFLVNEINKLLKKI